MFKAENETNHLEEYAVISKEIPGQGPFLSFKHRCFSILKIEAVGSPET
jgi:hypothetical protein